MGPRLHPSIFFSSDTQLVLATGAIQHMSVAM